jgi:hypothetical protein
MADAALDQTVLDALLHANRTHAARNARKAEKQTILAAVRGKNT